MTDLIERLDKAVALIRGKSELAPQIGLILGSGLGRFADTLNDPVFVPYGDIPGFPTSSVAGHAGRLVLGRHQGTRVAVLQGRVHFYEGYDLEQVVFPARVLVRLGCKILVITNASGGVSDGLEPGDLVLLRDHLNLMGHNPLRGRNVEALGPRFPDMSNAYDAELRGLAREAAAAAGVEVKEGVYAANPGPSYETPAEVRMSRAIGADLVGMSTVPEVIAAHHMGARIVGISCVTNLAAGISSEPLSHEEVAETANRVEKEFIRLIGSLVERLGSVTP